MESAEFESLYQRHAPEVLAAVRRIVREEDSAQDVLQEVFIRAWKHRDTLPEIRNLGSWLARIAVNLSLNALRARNRKRELFVGDRLTDEEDHAMQRALADFATPGPEAELILNSRRDVLRRLIAELSAEQRAVIELVDLLDYSIRETSETLGIPDGTVKSRLFYGRRILSERARGMRRGEEL
jgi:RNA polymerase sigma-70 factor (ECF subfamily)